MVDVLLHMRTRRHHFLRTIGAPFRLLGPVLARDGRTDRVGEIARPDAPDRNAELLRLFLHRGETAT
jgi:hypothetical protein